MDSGENRENSEIVIDLSKSSLQKIEKANNEQKEAVCLILDHNALQKLDNLDSYQFVKKLSLGYNKLIRMEGVSNMVNLTFLDISYNSLVCIEGLKNLKKLKHLNLCGNKIKTIDHLSHNLNLEYLNLSQNIIGHISDISHLINLKELHLNFNEIAHLRQCEKNLPHNLEILALSNNCIIDLNEISHLVLLRSLKELSFCNNPCLEFTDSQIDFNYRPFVKNWCSSIIILDGSPLDDIECLKAEWLYSQGRGRSFRPGEHVSLAKYLTTVCPRTAVANVESEDEKKLRLILSKAQHHQQQLQEQVTDGTCLANRHKLFVNRKKSGVLSERMASSYHDTTNCDISTVPPELMSRSLDGSLLQQQTISPVLQGDVTETFHNPLETATTLLPVPESLTSPDVYRPLHPFPPSNINSKHSFPLSASLSGRNLSSSSKTTGFSNVEGKIKAATAFRRNKNNSGPFITRKHDKLMSPSRKISTTMTTTMTTTTTTTTKKVTTPKKKSNEISAVILGKASSNGKGISEKKEKEELSQVSDIKIKKYSISNGHEKEIFDFDGKENVDFGEINKKDIRESDIWKAALCIQRHWRGYRTRNLNRDVYEVYKSIQSNRIQDYIIKVANDMEATKVALEGHRKLQVLQMQAINALWKKMVTLQPGESVLSSVENKNTLQGLAETCTNLNKQVEELQSMMKVMHNSNQTNFIPTATQTEIVAVHTPQGEAKESFPYYPRLERPNILQMCEEQCEQMEKLPSEPEECSEINESVIIAPGAREMEKEEAVCWTPACQEGKDLLGAIVPDGGSSMKTDSRNEETENDLKNVKKFTETENHHNGCSFS